MESVLAPFAKAHEGKVAIAVKNLDTGESYSLNADEPMPTASLIKFPVMVEAYYQFAEGKAKPTDMCVYERDPKVPGSGILVEHFSAGHDVLPPRRRPPDDRLVATTWRPTSCSTTSASRPRPSGWSRSACRTLRFTPRSFRRDTSVFPERSKKFGLGSTTANEMVKLLEMLHENKLVGPAACAEMRKHMEKCDDKDKFPRFLPPGTKVEHKTGSVNDARTDAGIIYVPDAGSIRRTTQPIAVCVMTNDNKDHRWRPDNAGNLLCAKVAKAVYDHFAAKK